jgi:S1-C subfamily serine protease
MFSMRLPVRLVVAFCMGALGAYVALAHAPRSVARDEVPAYRSSDEQRVVDTYKRVGPGVVFIATETFTVDPMDLFPEIQQREGSGSGFVIDARKGIVLTNLHVIRGAHKMHVYFGDSKPYEAKVLGSDGEYDVAVLKIIEPPQDIVAIPFADSARLEVGQGVLAIGNPFGLNRTLTSGIISSLERVVKNPGGGVMKGLIQTDAAINPGNSGGPLLDLDGRVIGINTAILSQVGESAGIGFAVPINSIRRVLPELLSTGKVLRLNMGWLLVDTNQGPMVRRILKDSPADKAGIQPIERMVDSVFIRGFTRDMTRADIIIAIDDQVVQTSDEVDDIVAHADPQKTLSFVVRRGSRKGPERVVQVKPVLR